MEKRDSYRFRRLSDSEIDQGYQILCDAVEWLRIKKIEFWTNGISRKIYEHWQARGNNYAMVQNDQICFVISAMSFVHPSWKSIIGNQPLMWLRMAAVADCFRNQNVGQKGFQCLFDYFKESGEVSLYGEHVSRNQFLSDYYEQLEFKVITQQKVRGLDGMLNMTLLQKRLDQ